MPDYRAYSVGDDGHYHGSRAFFCDNDRDAIEWARQLFGEPQLELWSGSRLVKSSVLRGDKTAISHEVREGKMVPKRD